MGKEPKRKGNPIGGILRFFTHLWDRFREVLDPRMVRLISAVALFLTAILVFIIVFTTLSKKKADEYRYRTEVHYEDGLKKRKGGPSIDDLLLPEDFPEPQRNIYLYRTPQPFWSDQDIAGYWINIDDIVMDDYTGTNDRLIREKLDAVP